MAVLLFGLGALAATALLVWFGFAAIWAALSAVGWRGFAALCALQLGLIAVNGTAWHLVTPGVPPRRLPFFIWGRWVRTAAADALPFSQLSGPLAGMRIAVLHGIAAAAAAASVIVDVATEFLTQLLFALLGLIVLLRQDPATALAAPALLAVLVMATLGAGFIAAQHGGGRRLIERAARPVVQRFASSLPALDSVYAALAVIHDRPLRVAVSAVLHLLEWLGTGLAAWLALGLMGTAISPAGAVGIEGLVFALRAAAFAVPLAVGVQEGAYLLLGAAFGLAPEQALALSFLKRGRDIAVGVPALIGWQAIEGGRLWWRARAAEPIRCPDDLRR